MDSSRNQATWWKMILVVAAMIFAFAQAAWAADPVKLWGPEGVPFNPGLIGISDGLGGVIIIGDDQGDQSKLVIQRIDTNGVLIWEEGDVYIHTPGRDCPVYNGTAVSDGIGGMIIVWQVVSFASDMYAQRIDSKGKVLWPDGGLVIPACPDLECEGGYGVQVIHDGNGGAIIAWIALGNPTSIMIQRVSSNGTFLWGPHGKKISGIAGRMFQIKIAGDGEGGVFIAWEDESSEWIYPYGQVNNIYMQRLDQQGQVQWPGKGVKVSGNYIQYSNYYATFTLTGDEEGGAITAWVGWHHLQPDDPRICLQKVDSNGTLRWQPDAVVAGIGGDPELIPDGSGGAIVGWQSNSYTLYVQRIKAQRITAEGALGWGAEGVELFAQPYNVSLLFGPKMISDLKGGAIISWSSPKDSEEVYLGLSVKAQRLDGTGQVLWGPDGFEMFYEPDGYNNYDSLAWVVSDGESGVISGGDAEGLLPGEETGPFFAQRVNDQFTSWATRTLKVRKTGRGSGSVIDSSGGIDCGFDCWEPIPIGTAVALASTPDQSSGFVGWEGDADCADGSLSMDTNKLCEARFELLIPDISISPLSKNFDKVDLGSSSSQRFAITNQGLVNLDIGDISVHGSDADEFILSQDGCSRTVLFPNQPCQLDIVFVPISYGSKTAEAMIPSNDPDQPLTIIPLIGVATQQDISVKPTYAYFGYVPVGNQSEQSVIVQNDGNKELTISAIGSPSTPFSWNGGTCSANSVILPGENCTITILFAPSTEAFSHSCFEIFSNSPGESTQTVCVGGVSGSPFTEGPQGKWKTSVVSKGGSYNSIAIDPMGYPHISFLDRSNPLDYVLKHSFFDGRRWHTETADTGDVGWSNSIALDRLGHIHITYHADDPSYSLRYAHFDGVNWSIVPLEQGGKSASIAVDNDCNPHISLVSSEGALKYIRYDGASWISETIPTSVSWCDLTSIALTSSNRVHISFIANSPRKVYWASNVSGAWEVKEIGESDGVGCSLALDRSGNPHFVYSAYDIKYSRVIGPNIETQTLTGGWHIGRASDPDIAVDLNDWPYVCFSQYINVGEYGLDTIVCAHFNGENWKFDLVDLKNAGYPSVALDYGGNPHISYYRYSGGEGEDSTLMYAYRPGVFLTLSKQGNGTGVVTSSPAGINCGPVCKYDFQPGTQLTLTALPDPDSGFAGWVGCPNPSGNTCSLLLTDHIKVTALFSKFILKVGKSGINKATGAVVSSDGKIDCGADCMESYPVGTAISLTAIPDPDSGFAGWTGCTGDTLNPAQCMVVLDKNVTVKAKFSRSTLKVKKASVNKGTGIVTSSDGKIDCGIDCSDSYPSGTPVTLTAQPDVDSTFLGWSGACSGTTPECVITLNKNTSVTAKFVK